MCCFLQSTDTGVPLLPFSQLYREASFWHLESLRRAIEETQVGQPAGSTTAGSSRRCVKAASSSACSKEGTGQPNAFSS